MASLINLFLDYLLITIGLGLVLGGAGLLIFWTLYLFDKRK